MVVNHGQVGTDADNGPGHDGKINFLSVKTHVALVLAGEVSP